MPSERSPRTAPRRPADAGEQPGAKRTVRVRGAAAPRAAPGAGGCGPIPAMPTSARPRTFFLIMQVEQLARRQVEAAVAAEGITAGQYTLLSLLAAEEPRTSAALSRRLRITAQSMGEALKALVDRGLVEREVDPDNRRAIIVRRTAEGRRVHLRCEKAVDRVEQAFFADLPATELNQLRSTLDALRQHAIRLEAQLAGTA
jgi:DNA-binding MarR family transcriptional regulator